MTRARLPCLLASAVVLGLDAGAVAQGDVLTKVINVNWIEAEQAADVLEGMLPPEAVVRVNAAQNQLIVKATQDTLDEIGKVLAEVDARRPTFEVELLVLVKAPGGEEEGSATIRVTSLAGSQFHAVIGAGEQGGEPEEAAMEGLVVVADADQDVREAVADALADLGLEVAQAENAAGLQQWMGEERPGLIVLGDNLGDMPAIGVLGELKDDPATEEIPVVWLSRQGEEDAPAVWEEGAAGFLTVPFNPDALRGLILRIAEADGPEAGPESLVELRGVCRPTPDGLVIADLGVEVLLPLAGGPAFRETETRVELEPGTAVTIASFGIEGEHGEGTVEMVLTVTGGE